MLALPAMPWCRNKLIIRRSMRTALPDEVLRRKKTTIPVSPDFARVLASGLPRLVPSPDLLRYVNPGKIPSAPKSSLELRAAIAAARFELLAAGSHEQLTRGDP